MKAIVYTSNSGFTAQYAELLGNKIGIPVFSLKEALENLKDNSEIIYLGWLMAGQVKGYKKAAVKFKIAAVCGVGMGATGTQEDEVRKANGISEGLPIFTLQGGFDMNKLHGAYKFMMSIMKKTLGKKLAEKPDKTTDEVAMLDMLQNGGNFVSEKNLSLFLKWYEENQTE